MDGFFLFSFFASVFGTVLAELDELQSYPGAVHSLFLYLPCVFTELETIGFLKFSNFGGSCGAEALSIFLLFFLVLGFC